MDVTKGQVSSIDEENGFVKVILRERDDKVTDWLPLLVPYNTGFSKKYMPQLNQAVYVVLFTEQPGEGLVLGSPMRGGCSTSEIKTDFPDGGYYKYDSNSGTLEISPASKIIINGDVEITGKLTVSDLIDTKAGVSKSGTPYNHP